MSTKTKQNEPINPCVVDVRYNHIGLTKREYFAALALQGLLACSDGPYYFTDPNKWPNCVSDVAVKHADELIEALKKTKK